MRIREEVVDAGKLEKTLLETGSQEESEAKDDETVLYTASFEEMEENFVKHQTAQWVLYSLLLILAWGIGLLMLLYLPVRRYILRKDIRSRKLFLTPNAIVYKVAKPVPFPCFGVLKKEKHVLLRSVADVMVEQGAVLLYIILNLGHLLSVSHRLFGGIDFSLSRIENVGVRRPPSDDVKIHGIAIPNAFRKAVMMHVSSMRNEIASRKVSMIEDAPHLMMSRSKSVRHDSTPSGDLLLLQKLEEVGSSVKPVLFAEV